MDAGCLWLSIETARSAVRGELEVYGDNEFVERDEFGLLEGQPIGELVP